MSKETKNDVLSSAVDFTMNFISLWNQKCEEFCEPEHKISKQDLIKKIEEHGNAGEDNTKSEQGDVV